MEQTNLDSLPIGTSLMDGKYVIEQVLDHDETSFTYLAWMTSRSEDVEFGDGYIPVFLNELFLQDFQIRDTDGIRVINYQEEEYNYRTDFKNKADSLSKLRHPNLVHITDVFEENETVYYASDYLQTTSLIDYVVQHGALSEREVLNIVRDIGGAMRQMHRNGIIHSKITPNSIQIDEQGRAYLSDFGFECFDEKKDTMLPDFYMYYAPERETAPTSDLTEACDIYSLGAIIYYMLIRKAPPSPSVLFDGFPKSKLLPFASARAVDCIAKAMSLRRTERYESLEAMLQDLDIQLPPMIPSEVSVSTVRYANMNHYATPSHAEVYEEVKYALPVGTILESKNCQYEITKVLAQGAFGIIYIADLYVKGNLGVMRSNMRVCLKEFFMKDVNGRKQTFVTSRGKSEIYEKYRGKFLQESIHLSELKHPNIVKVFEAFEANNTYYYAMEFIDGTSLDDYIGQHDGLPLQESVMIINEVGQALAHMHKNNMLHLDLKPLNVMRRDDGHVVLIDFGLSKQYDDDGTPETSTSIGAGTPGYAPLEQMNYHEGRGFPVTMDVYALTATFYKMLTGRTPQKSADILNDGLDKEPLIQRGIDNDTIALLEAGMNPTRKGRLQSVDEFLDRVNRLSI